MGESGTWYSMELCSRLAEARLRLASVEATISGHGASTGVIEEQRLRPALPKRRRRDGERDGGPRDSRWRPHRSDKDRVSTYGTLQGKVKLIKQFSGSKSPSAGLDRHPDPETGGNRGKQRPASPHKRKAARPLPVHGPLVSGNRSL